MSADITVTELKRWLDDGQELAIFDLREHGEYGEGHLFFAVSLPYSRLELDVSRLAPNRYARIVVYDDGTSGVAVAAQQRLKAIGYHQVFLLSGGALAWEKAGYTLFEGVNVPSKTFGEHIEALRHTRAISAHELHKKIRSGEPLVVLDGRPFSEYQKMSIPGSLCCPNGELSARFDNLVVDDNIPVVVNCAGRTRSIIGAQTLIDLGVKNPIYALENGTQGWMLADYSLEHGQNRCYHEEIAVTPERIARAGELARSAGVTWISPEQVRSWQEQKLTVYLLDVRTEHEFNAEVFHDVQHAPGGQLQQATDQYVGVRNARLVLIDSENVRAPITAYWLRQMGHQAHVLTGGNIAAQQLTQPLQSELCAPELNKISADQLKDQLQTSHLELWDIRSSQAYREGHIPGSKWISRPHIVGSDAKNIVFISDDPQQAGWYSLELAPTASIVLLADGVAAWQAAGGKVDVSLNYPSDAERIDYLFFTHDRHHGNKTAARRYLKWEIGLWQRLHVSEKAVFKPIVI